MKRIADIALVGLVSLAGCRAEHPAPSTGSMDVTRAASRRPTTGDASYFTGSVQVTPVFAPRKASRTSGGSVAFEPGARSAWHTHPAGQTLIVTAGTGWVQEWGGPKLEVKPGDVVWTPPGVKHWHGASEKEGMTHLAIQEVVDGVAVSWLEHVTDQQYRN